MREYLGEVWRQIAGRWEAVRGETDLWMPAVPGPSWTSPVIAVGALVSLILLAGVALLSLAVLLTALLTAHLLLQNVFGVASVTVRA